MKTNIKVDTEKIAEGILAMHYEIDAEGPLAFGMLDARLMGILEKQLKEKAAEIFPAPIDALDEHYTSLPDVLKKCLDDECTDTRRGWVKKTNDAICKAVYRLATKQGAMIV